MSSIAKTTDVPSQSAGMTAEPRCLCKGYVLQRQRSVFSCAALGWGPSASWGHIESVSSSPQRLFKTLLVEQIGRHWALLLKVERRDH